MSHILTLSIPFIFLGRHKILDPTDPTAEPPLSLVYKTFQTFCPRVPILEWTLDTNPVQESWAALHAEQSAKWLLRPAPCATATLTPFDTARGWRQGDGQLSPAETTILGDDLWACPLLLQRFGVPFDTASSAWSQFLVEVRMIFNVLETAFVGFRGYMDGVNDGVKYWDVVVGEKCFLRVAVEPEAFRVDFDMGRKIVMLQTAFEAELDLFKSASEVLWFASASRWLEGMLLGQLAAERREAWLELGKAGSKVGCKSSISSEEERYLKTQGRERQWWDVVHNMENEDVLEHMLQFQQHRSRLAVSVHANEAKALQVIFQGQRTMLNPDYLVAYTKLIALLVDMAASCNVATLAEKLEVTQRNRPTDLTERFAGMLDFLTRGEQKTRRALLAVFLPYISPAVLPPTETDHPPKIVDPFCELRTYIATSYGKSRKGMALFMKRYERAGGYMPTKEEKLCGLLEIEEEKMSSYRKKKPRLDSKPKANETGARMPPKTDEKPSTVDSDVEDFRKSVHTWLLYQADT